MKVYVQMDFEGIAGLVQWDDYATDSPMNAARRTRMRHLLTAEVNAAVEGAFAAGATQVLIWDSHGPSNNCDNLYVEELHPEAEIIIGTKGLPGPCALLDASFHAGIHVGAHAMRGTEHAITPHNLTVINGQPYGEVGTFILVCGWFNVPMVFISGDKAGVAEATKLVPNVETVVTKEAFGPYSAKTRTPQKARQLIREGVERALKRRDEIVPVKLTAPFRFEDTATEGTDFMETYTRHIEARGHHYGVQDLEPELSRFNEKRARWRRFRSFIVPETEKRDAVR